MLTLRHQCMLATALAVGLVVAAPLASGQVRAPESATVPTNPGFKPDTGQINPGVEHPAPSMSADDRKIPTPEEARAALMMPVATEPSAGAPVSGSQASGAISSPSEQTASGQPPVATTGAATSEKAGTEPAESVSSGSSATTAAGLPPPSGPIGATGQTMPAKFSNRNDILDRTPIMAWPQSLSDQERQRIYQAVMADKSQPTAEADTLAPAGELSTEQALNEMHPLPASLGDIKVAKRLKYVKGKDKVLLVEPSTRIVVEQIKS